MIKYYLTMLALLLMNACGPHATSSVEYAADCFDGCSQSYSEYLDEWKGPKGNDGMDGTDSVSTSSTTTIIKETVVIETIDAAALEKYKCSVEESDVGATIQCGDGTSVELEHGVDGENGLNGLDATNSLVDIIDPCGEETQFDEVLLVYELDGELVYIAYFAGSGSATKARLVILDEGVQYQTTDGTQCKFKIEQGELVEL